MIIPLNKEQRKIIDQLKPPARKRKKQRPALTEVKALRQKKSLPNQLSLFEQK